MTVTQLCVDYIKCGKFPKVVRLRRELYHANLRPRYMPSTEKHTLRVRILSLPSCDYSHLLT